MKKESIVMFRDQMEAIMALTSIKDVKAIVGAIIGYGMNGESDVEVPQHLQFGWTMIRTRLDMVNDHYQEVSDRNREKAKKRWDKCHGMPEMPEHATAATAENGCHNDNDNDNDISPSNEGEINAHASTREKKTVLIQKYPEDVDAVIKIANDHCIRIGKEEAQHYLDFRVSRNWIPNNQNKPVKPSGIPSDLRIWLARDQKKENTEGVIGGVYVSKN